MRKSNILNAQKKFKNSSRHEWVKRELDQEFQFATRGFSFEFFNVFERKYINLD